MTEGLVDLPKGYEELSEEDKQIYQKLRMYFLTPSFKNRRNKSLETFHTLIELIKSFVARDEVDEKKRAYVCGIAWIGDSIAVNTRNMMILTSKCKAGINGLFQSMGYGTIPAGSGNATAFVKYFPNLRDNYSEIRQWTIRRKMSLTPSAEAIACFVQDGGHGKRVSDRAVLNISELKPFEFNTAPPPVNTEVVPKEGPWDDFDLTFSQSCWSDDDGFSRYPDLPGYM
jgi:hypothetical protein